MQYLGANVPQAWAAGSVFHLLQAMLGLQADAPNQRLCVDPHLPAWLPSVALRGPNVGRDEIDLDFWREGNRTLSSQKGRLVVQEQSWRPWAVDTPGNESLLLEKGPGRLRAPIDFTGS